MKLLHQITQISKLAILTIGLMALPFGLLSQTALKIGSYSGCSNSEILIPVEIENFSNIGAFTIYLAVDSNNMELLGFEHLNEVLSDGNFYGSENIENQYITLSWFSPAGITLENGVLCDIRVLLKDNSVEFNFEESCEIARTDLTIVDSVIYTNGRLIALSSFIPDPITQSLAENSNATIELAGLPSEITCQWQLNAGNGWIDLNENPPYFGVNTSELTISGVNASMNGNNYRGLLSNGECIEGSVVSELFIATSGVGDHDQTGAECYMRINPNPADDYFNCVFNQNIQNAKLILISMDGSVVLKNKIGSIIAGQSLSLKLESIASGLYVLKLFNNDQLLSNSKVMVQ
ncbi:MAG: hypothetical protein A2W85_01790 [Bacteroidetes bacterium GWF2_41_31]|nr:MAG: hypothetical protein A2W85_01790 [Bacteroidetes bacterium GWF2_41_31]OFZ02463.1 MAG: hypothetical protein A2338_08750 [Bacteroidetes bacterium RIFOXYB12_FULL_41_6]